MICTIVVYKIYTNLVFYIIFVYILHSFCTNFLVRAVDVFYYSFPIVFMSVRSLKYYPGIDSFVQLRLNVGFSWVLKSS